MKRNTALSILASLTLIFALALGVAFSAKPDAVKADSVQGTSNITLVESNGTVATAVTGTSRYIQFWGSADCFSAWIAGPSVAGAPPTVTNKLQVSADDTYWADLTSFTAQSSASTVLTRTTLAGAYLRTVATVGNTNPVTYSVKCVIKNTYGATY